MCVSQNSYAPFLSYGTHGAHFLTKFKFFLDIWNNWIKLWSKMVFLTFWPDMLLQNYEITLKVSGNPEKFSKKIWTKKIMAEILLDGGNPLILKLEHYKCLFSSFFQTHQNSWFWLQILITKWQFLAPKWIPLCITSVKDSKNVTKPQIQPLNHWFPLNPLKNLCGRYFSNGA